MEMRKAGEEENLGRKVDPENSGGHNTFEIYLAGLYEGVMLGVGYIWDVREHRGSFIHGLVNDYLHRRGQRIREHGIWTEL